MQGRALLHECRAVSAVWCRAAVLRRAAQGFGASPQHCQRRAMHQFVRQSECLKRPAAFHSQRRFKTVLRSKASDPWTLLGVTRSASEQDLKKAYIKLAKEHHPDRTGGDDTKFKEVKEAYDMIKNGDAGRMYADNNVNAADMGAGAGTNTSGQWAQGYGSYAGNKPPGFENMQYSSSQSSFYRDGTEETVYTFKDATGTTFTYTEKKHGGDQNFWGAYQQAQQEALHQEAERMKQRAQANEEYRKVFENWASHKVQQTVDYQQYVRARDKAFYRFIVLWFWVFLFLRILINIMV
eukprot:TRINITY_DN24204_c0_g1_i1.p1 TRINITY_DN24204_c0_g1~~TRINITY_DN24204_c0_g1_i1.p1  ORF type:complete len:309 (+),score=66.59 TRINITY_DN24204_c0_g1_i1:44-928(+)